MIIFSKKNRFFLFLVATFIFNLLFSVYYLTEQSTKDNNYVKDIFATGQEYLVPPGHSYLFGDADAYNKLAYSFLEYGQFYNPVNRVSAWVTPGYPLFLAIIYLLFGYNFISVLIVQNILLSLTYYFLFNTVLLLSNSLKSAWITVCLAFINIRFTTYVQEIYTEILFFFLLSVIFFLYIKVFINSNEGIITRKYFILLGLLSGLTILVRPVVFPFLFVLFLHSIISRLDRKMLLISALITLIVTGIWIGRNYFYFDRFFLSTNSEITMAAPYLDEQNFDFFETYDMRVADQKLVKHNLDKSALAYELKTKNISLPKDTNIKQGYIYEDVFYIFSKGRNDWIYQNPVQYAMRSLYLFKTVLSPYTNDLGTRNKIITTILWFLIILPAFLYLLLSNKNRFTYLLLISALALGILPSLTIIDPNLRYQLPIQLILIIPASLFWSRIIRRENINRNTQL